MLDNPYLKPGRFIESNAPEIVAFAQEVVRPANDEIDRATRLYEAVRDHIAYDPYCSVGEPQTFTATRALAQKRGQCISKAALLAACARAAGIQARLGFADVRNHLASPRLLEANGGNVFRWHAYTDLNLGGKWVKATPAFDSALCARAGIEPLQFDGRNDSVFQAYDRQNRRHMEYVLDRGQFADVPFELIVATWRRHSPKLFTAAFSAGARSFADEVELS